MKRVSLKTDLNWHLQRGKPNLLIAAQLQSHTWIKSLKAAQLHRTIQNVGVDFETSYYGNKQSI